MVISPPNNDANAIGINTRLGETFADLQAAIAAGNSSATAPTLFMKAEATAQSAAKTPAIPNSVANALRNGLSANRNTPDRPIAALNAMTVATVNTTGSANPSKADAAETSPSATAASNIKTDTKSCRSRPDANPIMPKTKIAVI
jgi:hypothetical protein